MVVVEQILIGQHVPIGMGQIFAQLLEILLFLVIRLQIIQLWMLDLEDQLEL
jgi:hypothetical protein